MANIPGELLTADMDEDLIMALQLILMEFMVKTKTLSIEKNLQLKVDGQSYT